MDLLLVSRTRLIRVMSLVLMTISHAILSSTITAAEWAFSHERGFYDSEFELEIATDLEGASIRFTTDGSPPSREVGTVYEDPLKIAKTTVVRVLAFTEEEETQATHTYLFAADVAKQEAKPDGYIDSINSGRHGASRPHTFDWAMDPEVLEDVANNGRLEDHLSSLPSLALTMDVEDLNYIYRNHTKRGVRYERATSVELIYPDVEKFEGFKGFQIVCGIRMQGGGAVDQARKKSFRLLFKR